MSLYVKVQCNFYTHRKTVRLRRLLGDDAFWIPPRLWAYAAENQPDGCFKDYSAEEMALLLGYSKDASSMLQALLQAGFLDEKTMQIHGWDEHNAYHRVYSERAKAAAAARWPKDQKVVPPPVPPLPKVPEGTLPDLIGASIPSSNPTSNASSINPVSGNQTQSQPEHSQLLAMFFPIFRRPPGSPIPCCELQSACEIVRNPNWRNEAKEILDWYAKVGAGYKYFPHSLSSLLSEWTKFLDHSRNQRNSDHETSKRNPENRNVGTMHEGKSGLYKNAGTRFVSPVG